MVINVQRSHFNSYEAICSYIPSTLNPGPMSYIDLLDCHLAQLIIHTCTKSNSAIIAVNEWDTLTNIYKTGAYTRIQIYYY